MKSKPDSRQVPKPTDKAVDAAFPRPKPQPTGEREVIFLRVAGSQKKAIEASAKVVGLSVTDYLVQCHEVVLLAVTLQTCDSSISVPSLEFCLL